MKKLITVVLLGLLSFAHANGNIIDIAEGNGNFQTLKTVVDVAGLTDTLKSEGPFTVFAPTDEAFAKLPAELTEYLLRNPEVLKSVLLYHVMIGEYGSDQLSKKHSAATAFGPHISFKVKQGLFINTSRVVAKDVKASNGVIHAIDTVLLPKTRSYKFLDQRAFESKAYLGLWNDFARTANDFQDNTPRSRGVEYSACFDSTALYTVRNSKEISLTNTCYRRGDNGSTKVEDIEGVAKIKSARKLKIAFGSPILRGIQRVFTRGGADYWVFGVGEKNESGLYSWALVSGPKRDYIFVLSRGARVTKQQRADIISLATLEGLPVRKLIFDEDR